MKPSDVDGCETAALVNSADFVLISQGNWPARIESCFSTVSSAASHGDGTTHVEGGGMTAPVGR